MKELAALTQIKWIVSFNFFVHAEPSKDVIRGLGGLYAELIQGNRALRTTFLGSLLKPFDAACDLHSPIAASTDLR